MKITVQTRVAAPPEAVWHAWTNPADIMCWNAASDDWHTTSAEIDLRAGGRFSYRMEAKDGSMGFDFAGTFTEIVPPSLIRAKLGDRSLEVAFAAQPDHVTIRETFEAEPATPKDMQRQGWQAILDNFARHMAAKTVR